MSGPQCPTASFSTTRLENAPRGCVALLEGSNDDKQLLWVARVSPDPHLHGSTIAVIVGVVISTPSPGGQAAFAFVISS
jgi:hypothetical protein